MGEGVAGEPGTVSANTTSDDYDKVASASLYIYINWLHLYSAFLLMERSALQRNASDIYPFTHRWRGLLSKVPSCTSAVVGGSVSCQGHFDTWWGGVRIELATFRLLWQTMTTEILNIKPTSALTVITAPPTYNIFWRAGTLHVPPECMF